MLRNALAARVWLVASAVFGLDSGPASADPPRTRNVAIVVHNDVELLDFAGPGEVFAASAHRGTREGTPWFNVYTVAPGSGEIVSQGFLTITPQYTIENAPKPDVLVVPGGSTGVLLRDDAFMKWVGEQLPTTEITLSVCTGAFVLAKAGALDGKTITTHRSALEGLRREVPTATVVDNVRFVDNGSIVTSAGVSAGIDGSLHVVARLLGLQIAEETAHYMQYEWNPTEAERATYSRTNPQLDEVGTALQEASILREAGETDRALEAYREITATHPDEGEAWYYVGLLLHDQGRLEEALDAHLKAAAVGAGRFRRNGLYNAACAYALLGEREGALDFLQRCADAGSMNAQWTLDDADLASLHEDPRFSVAVATMHVNEARTNMSRNNDGIAEGKLDAAAARGFTNWPAVHADPAFERIRATSAMRERLREHPPTTTVTVSLPDEPGERLVVRGRVLDSSGSPVAGALLSIFHADSTGHYTRSEGAGMDEANSRLYGFLRTAEDGRFEFTTIRPAGYPERPGVSGDARYLPQHIHVDIEATGFARYRQQWVFRDDPRLTPHWQKWASDLERPVLEIERGSDGVQEANVEVILKRS